MRHRQMFRICWPKGRKNHVVTMELFGDCFEPSFKTEEEIRTWVENTDLISVGDEIDPHTGHYVGTIYVLCN